MQDKNIESCNLPYKTHELHASSLSPHSFKKIIQHDSVHLHKRSSQMGLHKDTEQLYVKAR